MPSSKKTQAIVPGAPAKAPSARAVKRATAKSTPAAQNDKLVRGAPQDPSAYAASAWGGRNEFEVTVPSGQKCLCKELSVERLIEMGLLQAINSLEGLVANQVLPGAQGQRTIQVDMASLVQNADKLTAVLELVNTIVCEAVGAPVVHAVPPLGEARVQGLVYVDSIDLTDRFALFSEVTGNLESLSSFR